MAAQTRTLKILLELATKGSFKSVAGDLKEIKQAADAAKGAIDKGLAGGNVGKAAGDTGALAKELRQVTAEAEKAVRAGDMLAQSEIRAATAAKDYGRALAVVDQQMALAGNNATKYNNLLAQQIAIQNKAAAEAQRAAQAQAQAYTQRMSISNQAAPANETRGAVDGLTGSLMGLATAYVSVQTVQTALDWAKQGAALQGVEQSFNRLASSAGKTGQVLLTELRAASQGMISDADLMQSANKAMLLGGQRLAKDLPAMLQIAQASAKATGQDVQYMFDSLVTGLARNSKQIIDNLGITVDIGKANEDFAKSIGKSVNALTDQEKAMAFQNAVMQQGAQFVRTIGTDSTGAATQIAQMETAWKNFTDNLKVGAADAFITIKAGLQDTFSAENITAFSTTVNTYAVPAFAGLTAAVIAYNAQAIIATASTYPFGVALQVLAGQTMAAAGGFIAIAAPLALIAASVGGTVLAFNSYNESVANATQNTLQAAAGYGQAAQALSDFKMRQDSLTYASKNQRDAITAEAATLADLRQQLKQTTEDYYSLSGNADEQRQKIWDLNAALKEHTAHYNELVAASQPVIQAGREHAQVVQEAREALYDFKDAQFQVTDAQITATDAVVYGTDALYEQIYALAELENKTIAASMAQDQLSFMQQASREAASSAIGAYFAAGGELDAMALKAWAARDALAALAVAQAQAQLAATPVSQAGLIDQQVNPEQYRNEIKNRAQAIADPAGAARQQRERQQQIDEINRANRESMKPDRKKAGGGHGRAKAKDSDGDGIPDSRERKGGGGKPGGGAREIDPKKEALDAAKNAAETAKSLASLATFVAPSRQAIDAYTSSLAGFVESLASRSGVINAKLAETTGQFLGVAKEAVGVLKMGTEAFTALKTYTSPPAAAISAFTSDLSTLVGQFAARSSEINTELAGSVMLFAEASKSAVGVIAEGVEAFAALKGYSGTAQIEIALFSLAMRDTYREFSERTKEVDLTLAEATNTFSDSASKAIGTVGAGVTAFKELEDFAPVPRIGIQLFSLALRDTYREFSERTKEIDMGLAEASNTFSDSAKKMIDTIAVGIDAFTKLEKYAGVPQAKLQMLAGDIRFTVQLMTAMAAQFDAEGVTAAAAFSESVNKILGPISTAVDAFSKLTEYKGVAPAAMAQVHADMRMAITYTMQTAQMLDAEGVTAAASFSASASTVFGAISAGTDALGGIRDYQSVAPEAFGAFAADFMTAVTMTSQLAGASGDMLAQSSVWKSNIDSAVANIRGGIDAIASLNGLSVNVSASVSASGSGGSGGAAPAGGGESGGAVFSAPGRAVGGPVSAGRMYTVGERGPELFVPGQSGRIVPNNQLSKAGRGGDININIPPGAVVVSGGANTTQTMSLITQALEQFRKQLRDEILAERRARGR